MVLGGDCSILLGCTLATRRRGRAGLLFLDGHADFYQPEAEPTGEAASMDLALVTGRGPLIVTDLEGRRPLVRDADVVALARRDAEETEVHGSQRIEDTSIEVIDLGTLRAAGVEATMRRALERLAVPGLDGFWIHLDADALDANSTRPRPAAPPGTGNPSAPPQRNVVLQGGSPVDLAEEPELDLRPESMLWATARFSSTTAQTLR